MNTKLAVSETNKLSFQNENVWTHDYRSGWFWSSKVSGELHCVFSSCQTVLEAVVVADEQLGYTTII